MNLLTWQFIRAIVCSSPQRDEFEVESLVATDTPTVDFLSKSKGFVVDNFIRPPVYVYIIFNQPVSIDSIHLDAKVNTQISNGFIISTSIEAPQSIEQTVRENKPTLASRFQQVARLLNEKNKSSHKYEFSRRLAQTLISSGDVNVAYFGARSSLYLDKTTCVCISITRTLNSTSACLRSVKVIGNPVSSQSGTNHELRSFTLAKTENETKTDSVEIPIEFIDELTHECMRMPIKLPSQKYIDKSTLDKYLGEESGKKEATKDPFTRLPFTSTYKPVIDETLKSRIDRFFFDNRGRQIVFSSSMTSVNSRREQVRSDITPSREDLKRNLRSMSIGLFKNELENNDTESEAKRGKTSKVTCSGCLNAKNQELCFYEIQTCGHFFCKNCIVSLGKKCAVCKVSFKNNQVINLDRANFDSKKCL